MLKEYDIDKLNPRPNPYAKELKKQVTIKISPSVIDYFKEQATQIGMPYQTLINLYLSDCVKNKRKLHILEDLIFKKKARHPLKNFISELVAFNQKISQTWCMIGVLTFARFIMTINLAKFPTPAPTEK